MASVKIKHGEDISSGLEYQKVTLHCGTIYWAGPTGVSVLRRQQMTKLLKMDNYKQEEWTFLGRFLMYQKSAQAPWETPVAGSCVSSIDCSVLS